MRFLVTEGLSEEVLRGRYVYLDNDFLSVLFEDEDALESLLELTRSAHLLIDPNTRFEFLRSVFLSTRRELLEKFIDNDDLFIPAPDHQDIFKQLRVNALTLSYLYAHNNCTSASFIDLFLASRIMLQHPKSVVITGNRKDFPSSIFKCLGILNYQVEKDGKDCVRAFWVLTFDKDKYTKAMDRWRRLKA